MRTQAVARLKELASAQVLMTLKKALDKVLQPFSIRAVTKALTESKGVYTLVTTMQCTRPEEMEKTRKTLGKFLESKGFTGEDAGFFYKTVGKEHLDIEITTGDNDVLTLTAVVRTPAAKRSLPTDLKDLINLRRAMVVNGATEEWRIETKHPGNILRQPSIAIGSWGWGANGDRTILQRDFSVEISQALKFLQRVYDFKEKKRNAAGGLFTFTQGDKVIRLSYDNNVPPSTDKRPTLDRQKKVPTYAEIYYADPEE